MTLFEYIAIAYSLVLSFAIVRCVTGLQYALSKGRYWTHVIWICSTLGICLLSFWTFWFYRETAWTFGSFLLALANPALLNAFAVMLLPEEMEHIESWEQHYYSVRVRLFAVGVIWTVLLFVISTMLLNMPLIHAARSYQVIMLIVFVTGLLVSNKTAHRVIACIPLLVLIPLMLLPPNQELDEGERGGRLIGNRSFMEQQ